MSKTLANVKIPDPFSYQSYRAYLHDVVTCALKEGFSHRSLARSFSIGSPNFLQQVLAGKRNLTKYTAKKIVEALGLSSTGRNFFLLLVQLDNPRCKNRERVLQQIRMLIQLEQADRVTDDSIYSHWLNSVLFVAGAIPELQMTPAALQKVLVPNVGQPDIANSLSFLLKKQWLIPGEASDHLDQGQVKFKVHDDIRKIDLQRSHLFFLDLAKHRLNDDLDRREYRGLTVAISRDQLSKIKQMFRDFYKQLNDELACGEAPDRVIRIQSSVFEVIRPSET